MTPRRVTRSYSTTADSAESSSVRNMLAAGRAFAFGTLFHRQGQGGDPMGEPKQSIDRPILKSAIVGGVRIEIFQSRTTRWLFDRARKRFMRLPLDVAVNATVLELRWTSYRDLGISGRDALVILDPAGTCRLRAAAA
jgi:hypothetical protein